MILSNEDFWSMLFTWDPSSIMPKIHTFDLFMLSQEIMQTWILAGAKVVFWYKPGNIEWHGQVRFWGMCQVGLITERHIFSWAFWECQNCMSDGGCGFHLFELVHGCMTPGRPGSVGMVLVSKVLGNSSFCTSAQSVWTNSSFCSSVQSVWPKLGLGDWAWVRVGEILKHMLSIGAFSVYERKLDVAWV